MKKYYPLFLHCAWYFPFVHAGTPLLKEKQVIRLQ